MMHYLCVDDEKPALDYLVRQLSGVDPEGKIDAFTDPYLALEHAKANPVDVAFLDIEMYGLNGIELAKRFKESNPALSVVFVTGFSQYAVDAFSVHACGYLLKPPEPERIRAEIELVKSRVLPEKTGGKRVRVQTFGSFEIFADGTPVKFGRSKSKELLAYLVDRRGAAATVQELLAVLFEDREPDAAAGSLLRTLVSDMVHSLKNVHAEDMVVKTRNNLSVDVTKFDCDYYEFLNGNVQVINTYCGEYMNNFSWAEFTTGVLDDKANLYG